MTEPTPPLLSLFRRYHQLVEHHIHEEFLRPNLGRFLEIVPNWDVFEKTSISTEVRVLVDSYGIGDHGLGAGLVVRGAAVMKSSKQGIKFWRAHCKLIETHTQTLISLQSMPFIQLTAYPRCHHCLTLWLTPFDDFGGWKGCAWSS